MVDTGGDTWDQIDPDTLPPEIINIIGGGEGNPDYVDLAALKAQVDGNTAEIVKLWEAIEEIDTVGGLVRSLVLDGRVGVNEGAIEKNKTDIKDLKDALNNSLTGLVLGGEYDANANWVKNPTNAGIDAGLRPDNPLPAPSEKTKGIYVIVTTAGELSGTNARADEDFANVGDWLISDGIHGWILMELGQQDVVFSQIGGDPYDNEKLGLALDEKISVGDTIDCGTYS